MILLYDLLQHVYTTDIVFAPLAAGPLPLASCRLPFAACPLPLAACCLLLVTCRYYYYYYYYHQGCRRSRGN